MYEQREGKQDNHLHMSKCTPMNEQYVSCEELFPRFRKAVGVTLWFLEDVEDVIQEAMLASWQECPALWQEDAVEPLHRWLFVAIRRLALNQVRCLNRHPVQSLDTLPAEPRDRREENCTDQQRREQGCVLLHGWMEELREKHPVDYRLLCGRFFEGRQVKELAAIEGLSENAASHRIGRTIQLFREWASRLRDAEAESR